MQYHVILDHIIMAPDCIQIIKDQKWNKYTAYLCQDYIEVISIKSSNSNYPSRYHFVCHWILSWVMSAIIIPAQLLLLSQRWPWEAPDWPDQYQLPSILWHKCTQSQNIMFLISSCSCLCPIHWSQVLSWEWRCSWSSADRRCTNYIWVINNFIGY